MPEISIVLGTWNRLEALQSAIWHIRDSIGAIPYEIICVDGGSTDGTLEWLGTQDDVLVLQQRRLVGACRAFTAGFRLARAPVVVHLNDDDEVQGECLQIAYRHLRDNADVGQVAFAFDLYTPGRYHHETCFSLPYANKGMTRRELGDRAGWWPDTFHTYGGDCELSCRIWEMGYKVEALRECKAHDLMTQDELRRINNPEGSNPDSDKFYELRKGIDKPTKSKRRILHIALNYGADNQPALERALRSMGDYKQIDWRKLGPKVRDVVVQECDQWDPSLVFMQLQTENIIDPRTARLMKGEDRIIVNWSGDVRQPMPEWYFELGKEIDWTLLTNTDWVRKLRDRGIQAEYLQIGFNQEIFHPWGEKMDVQPIVFLGNHYGDIFSLSKERFGMVSHLKERYGNDIGVYGTGWPFPTRHLDWFSEAAAYRGCKIAVGISQLELARYTSDRLHRAMGSGAFYLTKYYEGLEEEFQEAEHLEAWEDFQVLDRMIDCYLEFDGERQDIAREGCELVHAKHTWLDRAKELQQIIGWHEWK